MIQNSLNKNLAHARSAITSEEMLGHIRELASDEFAGRCPSTTGETKTLDYFDNFFKQLSAESEVKFKTTRQNVPAIEIHSIAQCSLNINGQVFPLNAPTEYVLSSRRTDEQISVKDSDLVFVGYGIVAPEYGWDDFKGLDVTGKTIVVLAGDPIIYRQDNPDEVDTSLFRGKELTYYGRWTYKFETAGLKNAAAVLIIHETTRAGYGWDVVTHSFGHEHFDLQSADQKMIPSVEGWLSLEAAKDLLQKCGHSYDELKTRSLSQDFHPLQLDAKFQADLESKFKKVESKNFIAVLPGSDKELANECIVYTAHWDHFGVTPEGVMSGALDNASGVAGVLALAKAFAFCHERSPRSVVFLLPTLEEQNLLGSRYYVQHPEFSAENTLAVLNLEMMNTWGKSISISSVCKGHSTLDTLMEESASQQGRVVVAEPQPEKGYLYRSDHVPFMQVGIPGLALFFPGMDQLEKRQHYVVTDYHKVTDKVKVDWDLSGAVDDGLLFFDIGWRILDTGYRATWNVMSEFMRRS